MYTSALHSSFWNHIVGFVFLTIIGIVLRGLLSGNPWGEPWWAYLGGPIGCFFIATSSWAIMKVGVDNTAMLIIVGQIVSSRTLDVVRGTLGNPTAQIASIILILAGMLIARSSAKLKT